MITKLLLLLTTGAALAAPDSVARFINGDEVPGNPAGIENGSLLWDSPAFFSPQPLLLKRVLEVSLPSNEIEMPPDGDHIAILKLTNGDLIRGSLVEVSEKRIIVNTVFGGEMTFRRDMVESLDINDKPEIYYTGPTDLEGWTQSEEGSWSLKNGTLISDSTSGISREIGSHEQIHIAFDLEWRSNNRFRLVYFADKVDPGEPGDCYELTCQSRYAYLRMKRGGGNQTDTIGTTSGVQEFREKEKVRLEIFHDRIGGKIRMMLDGRVVADWRDKAPAEGKAPGGAIQFLADSPSPIGISRILVTSWDGIIDGKWNETGLDPFGLNDDLDDDPEESLEEDDAGAGITLRNGDRIKGTTLGINSGKVHMKTSYGEVKLPVSRLRSFALRTSEEAANPELRWEPKRYSKDIRGSFADGGHITFRLDGVEDGVLKGYSQTFGEGSFSLSSFNRIEFNIHNWRLDELRNSSSW